MGRVIAVANQKGGVGKTTTAVNLSTSLAKKGKKVILIDGDPQGNATSGLGVEKDLDNSIYDVLVEEVDIKTTLQDTCVKTLKVCPSNMDLAGAEVELVSQMSREFRLKEKIDPIKDEFDYIIIDCPPSLGLITLNSFTAADSVLIPVQCEYYALEGLGQLLNTINLVKRHLNKNLEIEGAFPSYNPKNILDQHRKTHLSEMISALYIAEPKLFTGSLNKEQKKTFVRLLDLIMVSGEIDSLFHILDEILDMTETERADLSDILKYTHLSPPSAAGSAAHNTASGPNRSGACTDRIFGAGHAF